MLKKCLPRRREDAKKRFIAETRRTRRGNDEIRMKNDESNSKHE